MDEFDIIARYFAPLATTPGAFGLKDDAAVIPARPGFDLVVTTDQIAAGTDFFSEDPAESVAQKALRVNLSDLAAKGANPAGYLLTLALPKNLDETWLAAFAAGLGADQKHYGVSLLGGDMAATEGPLSISVTAMGFVPQGGVVTRGGAKKGDAVYVTGTIGDSGGGLALLKGEAAALDEAGRLHLVNCYRVPRPPVGLGPFLRDLASAAIDVSDGLIADLGHIASRSQVGIEVEADAIPRSPGLRALWGDAPQAIIQAATAGDDYQIAFTAPPGNEAAIWGAAEAAGVTVTAIGKVTAGDRVSLCLAGAILPVPKSGYRHF
jgi:thiamine-monophosphate kinase